MAKSKKRGAKNKTRAPKVSAERLALLREGLAELTASDLDSAELDALIEASSRQDADTARAAFGHLRNLVGDDKARAKSLRRGLHRLKQRGVATDDLAPEAAAGIRVSPDRRAGGGLPVLLAPPQINGERRFTFALPRGPGAVVVEAVFRARDLFRLMAKPSNRVAFRRWAQEMCEAPAGGLPERVATPPTWLERKLWEIGRAEKNDVIGREVDRNLLEHLTKPTTTPAHPAADLDLADAQVLSIERLVERPERLHGFYHGSAIGALRPQWYEAGGATEIEVGSQAALERRNDMKRPVADWAEQWGSANIVELLLDSAVFFEAAGDRDAARTFQEVGLHRVDEQSPGHDNRIRRFLLDVAIWQLSK